MSNKHNIQQRGQSYLVAVSRNGVRKRVTCHTMEEAQKVRATLELVQGTPASACWTLKHAADECAKAIWQGRANGAKALRNAESAVDFFGATTPLDSIDTQWADGYVARLKQCGNSNATINRKLAALSRIMSFARESSMMQKAPKLRRQREIGGRIRFLTQDEETRLLATLAGWEYDDHAEVVAVLADTGLRTGELWALEARDVNLDLGLITIWHNKAEKPKSVPMTTRVRRVITRRMELTTRGPLFPYSNSWMRTGWDRAKHSMGLSDDKQFVPHALRHTCASRLLQRGTQLAVVQEWLGHKTIEVTRRYGHLRPTDLMEAVKVLEAC